MNDKITKRGIQKFREVFGEDLLQEVKATSEAIDWDFRERVNDTLFGKVWCDEALFRSAYV